MTDQCEIAWLRTGDEAFGEMLALIDRARSSVRLETYIFAAGPLGERFRTALVQACQRGARVQVLIDAVGSLSLPESFWAPLKEAGGQFRWFNPLNLKRITFRDHRKLLVCDESAAVVGGFNIAAEYEGNGLNTGWRDVGLRVCGSLAQDLAASFDMMFARADFQHRPFTRLRRSSARQSIPINGGAILLSGPGRGRNELKRALLAEMSHGRRVRIASAYFLPAGPVFRSILRVARKGGNVQLILPGRSDVQIAQIASHAFYRRLLRAGVEIFEYQPQVLHTKLVIIDGACYAGSANLDTRSLHINYELMVRLGRPDLVSQAGEILDDHLRHSRKVDLKLWSGSRTLLNKLQERWACFILGRLDRLLMVRQLRRLRAKR